MFCTIHYALKQQDNRTLLFYRLCILCPEDRSAVIFDEQRFVYTVSQKKILYIFYETQPILVKFGIHSSEQICHRDFCKRFHLTLNYLAKLRGFTEDTIKAFWITFFRDTVYTISSAEIHEICACRLSVLYAACRTGLGHRVEHSWKASFRGVP